MKVKYSIDIWRKAYKNKRCISLFCLSVWENKGIVKLSLLMIQNYSVIRHGIVIQTKTEEWLCWFQAVLSTFTDLKRQLMILLYNIIRFINTLFSVFKLNISFLVEDTAPKAGGLPLNCGWRERHSQHSLFSGLILLFRFLIKEKMKASRGERPHWYDI